LRNETTPAAKFLHTRSPAAKHGLASARTCDRRLDRCPREKPAVASLRARCARDRSTEKWSDPGVRFPLRQAMFFRRGDRPRSDERCGRGTEGRSPSSFALRRRWLPATVPYASRRAASSDVRGRFSPAPWFAPRGNPPNGGVLKLRLRGANDKADEA